VEGLKEKKKPISERTKLVDDDYFQISFKKQVWKKDEGSTLAGRTRGYVVFIKYGESEIKLEGTYRNSLIHTLGHLLLALTNEEHHVYCGGY